MLIASYSCNQSAVQSGFISALLDEDLVRTAILTSKSAGCSQLLIVYVTILHSIHIIVATCPSWTCPVPKSFQYVVGLESDSIKPCKLIKTQADTIKPSPSI